MKQNNGITLIVLVIAIIVMIILAGVGISAGKNSIQNAEMTQFNAEMRIIHTRVNELVEEFEIDELELLGQDIPSAKAQSVSTALESESPDGFRYFNKTDLQEDIGVFNIDREVIINFSTREVVDINGIESDGTKKIYRLEDWINIIYVNKNIETEVPRFDLNKKVYGLNATILVENIEYKGNVGKGIVSYCTYNNETEGTWQTVAGTEIPVQVTGIYKVKLTDAEGRFSEKTVEITLTNKPKLDSGMTPVIYDKALEKWKTVDENSGDWYDYASDKAQWANVMLQDGLVVNADGTIDEANMGSMFVWIPRYMYQIPAENYHTEQEGEIKIKFLKGTTNVATDGTNVKIANASGGDNWNVHPAFCDGRKNDYANGEWDKEITGIWVAKFEASSSNPSASSGGGNTAELDVKVLPNVATWRGISPSNIYTVCKNMTANANMYGLSNNADAHLIKNSEWGMAVYLTQSAHGQKRDGAYGEVWNNPKVYVTGYSGSDANVIDSTTEGLYMYNEDNGVKASTTSNIYGIYDMSGGVWDKVAVFSDRQTKESSVEKLLDAEKKYCEIYKTSETDTFQENYDANSARYGNAMFETSSIGTGTRSWQNNFSDAHGGSNLVFARGGRYGNNSQGIFAFYASSGSHIGGAYGFRPVIVVE